VIAGLAGAALLVAACGGGDDAADTTTTSTSTTSTTSTTVPRTTTTSSTSTSTTVPVTPRQPLTGQPLESADDVMDRAALVVKIDNNRLARPNHSGLGVADIVFEEIVEARETRFAAVFHSQSSDPVGPIRSGRTQDIDLFTSFNAPLFVWSGGNRGVTDQINGSMLINMGPNNAAGYFRGPGRAPHNLYNTTDGIWMQTPPDHPGPPGQQFVYLNDGEEFDGDPVGGVRLPVGNRDVEWTWNAEVGTFERSQDGTEHVDVTSGRIGATNVVVMGVEYGRSAVDARSPEAQTIGEGPLYVFSDGKAIQGTWKREFNLFPIEFYDNDGDVIELRPGNTWIELAERIPTFEPDVYGVEVEIVPPNPAP
jgi:hypothetical protein